MADGKEAGRGRMEADIPPEGALLAPLRRRLYIVIFEADTPAGRWFDILLIWAILISVLVAMMETVPEFREGRVRAFHAVEWFFTAIFTVEYVLRLFCHRRPVSYAASFFGLVDLGSILPSYISLIVPGSQALVVIRVFRTLRLFRIFKLIRYMREARVLLTALHASRPKIIVFLVALSGIVITMGALMYLVEGEANGFTSIPKSIYWAVITLTTVGYGDLVPKTVLGQSIATMVMIMGYSIIAVPTGIVTAEIAQASRRMADDTACPACGKLGHESAALFCDRCGKALGRP
jgi:voltage-gated potassium channel